MTSCRLCAGVLVGLALLLDGPDLGAQAPGIVERASVTSLGAQANFGSLAASISTDGTIVAFGSTADNLVPDDRNGMSDIFVHDLVSGRTTRVSVASDGTEADFWSYNPVVSGDGRLVAFESDATNLVDGDTNGFADIFVHDRDTQQTWRVSVGPHGLQSDLPCYSPAISADGSTVAFQSYATTLVGGGIAGLQDVYVHELATGFTTRASVTPEGTPGNGSSWAPSLSGDGRLVAFSSHADDLVTIDHNGTQDIFVHDRVLGTTVIATVSTGGVQAASVSLFAALSGNGRYVAYLSWATNLVAGDTNGHADVFVHDLHTGRTVRVSVSSFGEQANESSGLSSMSWDGRYVVFDSHATTLVADDTNGQQDVFLHDLLTGRTRRVSVNAAGEQGDVLSSLPDMSADGRVIVFESHAENLVPDDTNAESDIFVVTLD